MKRIISLLLCLSLLAAFFVVSVNAESKNRLVDDANLLDKQEEKDITERLDEISEKYEIDVIILTVDSTNYKSPMDYADDYFDYNGYGYGNSRDGILLLISIEERDWWISTSGKAIDFFSDSRIDSIGNAMSDDLSHGYYRDAFEIFADECEYYIDGELNGFPFNFAFNIGLSLIVGILVALITTGIMKSKLKTVRAKSAANDYVKKGSMVVTVSRDLFLYRTIHRVARPKNNGSGSSHRSSSGRSHGGGGGKF